MAFQELKNEYSASGPREVTATEARERLRVLEFEQQKQEELIREAEIHRSVSVD